MKVRPLFIFAGVSFALAFSLTVLAHEGHIHSDETVIDEQMVGIGEPAKSVFDRKEARLGSNQLVLVYVPHESKSGTSGESTNGRLVLFLEDYATSAPQSEATIEVSINFVPYQAEENGAGIYLVEDVMLSAGTHEIEISLEDPYFPASTTVVLEVQDHSEISADANSDSVEKRIDVWPLIIVGVLFLALGYAGARFRFARSEHQQRTGVES